jgi:hypothetical protein
MRRMLTSAHGGQRQVFKKPGVSNGGSRMMSAKNASYESK